MFVADAAGTARPAHQRVPSGRTLHMRMQSADLLNLAVGELDDNEGLFAGLDLGPDTSSNTATAGSSINSSGSSSNLAAAAAQARLRGHHRGTPSASSDNIFSGLSDQDMIGLLEDWPAVLSAPPPAPPTAATSEAGRARDRA